VAWQRQSDERQHRGGETEDTTLVELMRILLSQKMKKKYTQSTQMLQMDGEDLKQRWGIFFENICK
jgi:hypothetical protein